MAEDPVYGPERAAAYLDVSRRHFERHVAPWLPCADLRAPGTGKALPRYRRSALDAFVAARTLAPASPIPASPFPGARLPAGTNDAAA